MPEANKIKQDEVMVDLDTSGPETEVNLPIEDNAKEEVFPIDTAPETIEQKKPETETEKKNDEELEDYSKGVQSRIAKLTRKMREAERREPVSYTHLTLPTRCSV